MKIVQIITRMDVVGGAQVHVKDLSLALKEKGHEVVILSGEGENIYKELSQQNVLVLHIQNLCRNIQVVKDVKAFFEIRKKLQEIQPDLVATHSSKAGIIGRLASRSLKIPTLFTAHGWSFTEGVTNWKRQLYRFIERAISRITDGIITVSQYDYLLALKANVASEGKMKIIHNGVHDLNERHYARKNPSSIVRLAMVARFQPPKQQLVVVKALQQLEVHPWILRFAGGGPELNAVQTYVKHTKFEQSISFLGDITNVEGLLQSTDIFILTSDWEGLPLSILEAMRAGLPIIASDVGGVKEAVYDNVNGFLIPKGDQQELTKRLNQLMGSLKLREEMGKASRQLYETHFSFQTMVENTEMYYRSIVKAKRNSGMSKEGLLDESIN